MNEKKIVLPVLHPAQKDAAKLSDRFNVLCCGRRWGKTKFGIYRLMTGPKGILEPKGYSAGWFAPSSKYVADVWDEITSKFAPIISYKNKQTLRIKFITGSTLDFWAMGENKDVARGRKYARVIIDEAAHIRYLEDAWNKAVAPTLTDYEGEAWFISTPNGLNFFYDLYHRGGEKHWTAYRSPTSENPYIPSGEIERARQDIPSLVYDQEYLAKFVVFGGNLVKADYIISGKAPSHLPIVFGVDLAISSKESADYTAIAILSRDTENGIVYVREVNRYRVGFYSTIQLIKAKADYWNPSLIAIERTQYQSALIQELSRTTNLPVYGAVPDKNKVTRFVPLLTRYEQHLVRHDPDGVPNWFRNELLAFPNGEHDDGVDAVSYAFDADRRLSKAKTVSTYAEAIDL